MAEPSSSSTERTDVVNNSHLCRLWTLTIASLILNALILVLLVAGAIIHHHHQHHGFASRDGRDGGCFQGQRPMGFGPSFHHFGGMGMNRGWGGPDGFRGGREGGPPAMGGAPGMPGMGGMMGGVKSGPPDPARMTDAILDHLSTTLTLTDDQKVRIKPIIEQQVAEIQKRMEAQRAAMQKQIEDAKARIKPLLTADQQKQLDAMPLPGQKPPAPDEAKQPAPESDQ
jgi:hypothetical protein